MEPNTKSEFHVSELIACANREVAMRRTCYPRWDKVDSVDQLKPGRKKELAMMEAVAQRLDDLSQENRGLATQLVNAGEAIRVRLQNLNNEIDKQGDAEGRGQIAGLRTALGLIVKGSQPHA